MCIRDRCTLWNAELLPDTLTEIGEYAFRQCKKLTEVTIGEKLLNVGEGAFYDCDGIKKVDWQAKVTRIPDRVFQSCYYIETVKLPETCLLYTSPSPRD